MRYFFSAGEASGDLAAAALAREIRAIDPAASFEGIGGERMRAAGFSLWRENRGWATLGPLAALPRIPWLLAQMYRAAAHVLRERPDAVVLVDFGAFNVRLAQRLRKSGYRGAIVDVYPPGAWLDRPGAARAVSAVAVAVPAFEHQRNFFESLQLPVRYFGHPLAGEYQMRARRPAAPPDGGTVALLPGSRSAEMRRHVPIAAAAFRLLRASRPNLGVVSAAPDAASARMLRELLDMNGLSGVPIAGGAERAASDADAALVASGTAVLECALGGVPPVVFYRVPRYFEAYVRRIYRGRFIAIPNVVLGREAVPEFVQAQARPEAIAAALDTLLRDPSHAYDVLDEFREALGPRDALSHIAKLCVDLASAAAC